MPLKLGKSKSSSGSELVNVHTQVTDENVPTKKKGFKKFFTSQKSKIPMPKQNSTDDNQIKYKDKLQSIETSNTPINNSPIRATCISVSPKLYTNSCASSTEELSNLNSNNGCSNQNSQSNVQNRQNQEVIIEEDYEDALVIKKVNSPTLICEPISKSVCHSNTNSTTNNTTIDVVASITTSSQSAVITNGSSVVNKQKSIIPIPQSIYNEPGDAISSNNKEIIETCRLSQMTPTNQFKDIRSRSGSDTDSLMVHPDVGVGSRCSTNSSSVSSAHTLSESPAIGPRPNSGQATSCTSSTTASPQQHTQDIPTQPQQKYNNATTPQQPYVNSPKGNTVICHHPSSPFAPPPSNTTTTKSETPSPSLTTNSTSKIVPRRPGRLNKPNNNNNQSDSNADSESIIGEVKSLTDSASKQYQQQPIYEEAWDVKIQKLIQDKHQQHQSSTASTTNAAMTSASVVGGIAASNHLIPMIQRPQSAVSGSAVHKYNNMPSSQTGLVNRTQSPSSQVPPAVPPHRRSSAHIKSTTSFMPQTTSSTNISRSSTTTTTTTSTNSSNSSKLKHTINPSFQEHHSRHSDINNSRQNIQGNRRHSSGTSSNRRHSSGTGGCQDPGNDGANVSDYDYAYNDTWSMGVQMNMNRNLSGDDQLLGLNSNKSAELSTHHHHLAAPSSQLDKIDSVESESSPGESTISSNLVPSTNTTTNTATTTTTTTTSNCAASSGVVDIDSLSNDSYEEPWDVRHGRVISELTSKRLIDPVCVLGNSSSGVGSNAGKVSTRDTTASPQSNITNWAAAASVSVSGAGLVSRQQSNASTIVNNSPRSHRNTVSSSNTANNNPLINTSIPLEDQPWYHMDCTRSRAESLLSQLREGSFLVRKSESCADGYSLTVKYRNEYVHMKISRNQNGYILGQYSHPYISIPHMLHHYSLTMVPVRGVESVQLTNPVSR